MNSTRRDHSIQELATSSGTIHYLLKRSSGRRTITIAVDERADISVSVPYRTAIREVEGFIQQKSGWITRKVEEARRRRTIIESRRYDDDHQFLFLGDRYPINISKESITRGRIEFDGSRWNVAVPTGIVGEAREALIKRKLGQWYREQAEEVLGARVFHFATQTGFMPRRVIVRTQKRMWGCCDFNTKTITLNWQIILSPLKVIDYVVIHELCHLVEPNHSKRFWNTVRRSMPDFEASRQWLKTHFVDMVLP